MGCEFRAMGAAGRLQALRGIAPVGGAQPCGLWRNRTHKVNRPVEGEKNRLGNTLRWLGLPQGSAYQWVTGGRGLIHSNEMADLISFPSMWICIPQTRRDLAKISPLRPFQTELFQHPSPDWQTHRGSWGPRAPTPFDCGRTGRSPGDVHAVNNNYVSLREG